MKTASHFKKSGFTINGKTYLKVRIFFLSIICLCTSFLSAQSIEICSWNLMNFGKSKSDEQIGFIAAAIKRVDILLIQEVVADDPGGAKAVARLGEALNKTGTKWEYRISDPTSGNNSYKKERYAIFWKPSIVTLIGKPWLEKNYQHEIDREPYYASFKCGTKEFTVVNFHAITKSMQPETEIKYFRNLPAAYPRLNLLFFGDFNLPQSHSVFYPLKTMGYRAAFTNQKTSLNSNSTNSTQTQHKH